MVAPAAERDAVAYLQTEYGMSHRRACRVLDCCQMTMRYQALPTDHIVLRDRMKAIAPQAATVRLSPPARPAAAKKAIRSITSACSRIYREEKLMVRRSGGGERVISRTPGEQATRN
jgi:hypothetical protein